MFYTVGVFSIHTHSMGKNQVLIKTTWMMEEQETNQLFFQF